MSGIDEYKEYVPLKSKLSYGGLNGMVALLTGIAFSAITFYYNVKLGLSASLIAIGWLIFAIWNTLNDPLFGFLEDKTKSEKYGRRIPYIRFGAPIFGFFFIICWFPFVSLTDELGLFINFLVVLLLFDTLYTIIGLIGYALPAEMCVTSKERAKVLAYGGVFWALGYVISFIVPVILLTGDTSTFIDPLFLITMIIIGIAGALVIFVSSYFIKENFYTVMESSLGLIDGVKETFKNKPFIKYEIANFSFLLAETILTTGVFYYVQFVLVLGGIMAMIPILLVFLMVFLFIPIFGKLVGKFGIKKIFTFALALMGFSFILCFFIGWNLLTAIIPLILVGIGLSATILLRPAIAADIIDYDETRTGKRRETSYAGMNAVIEKPAISVANWLFLSIIVFYGFQQAANTQSFEARLGIMIGLTVVPAIFLIISTIVMLFYPLDGPEWDKKKKEIIKIHEEKEKAYIQHLKEQGKL